MFPPSSDMTPRHTDNSASCLSSSFTGGRSSSSAARTWALTPGCSSDGAAGGSAGRRASSCGGLASCCSGGRLRDAATATGLLSAAICSAFSRWICCRLRPAGASFRPRVGGGGSAGRDPVSNSSHRCVCATSGSLTLTFLLDLSQLSLRETRPPAHFRATQQLRNTDNTKICI